MTDPERFFLLHSMIALATAAVMLISWWILPGRRCTAKQILKHTTLGSLAAFAIGPLVTCAVALPLLLHLDERGVQKQRASN